MCSSNKNILKIVLFALVDVTYTEGRVIDGGIVSIWDKNVIIVVKRSLQKRMSL